MADGASGHEVSRRALIVGGAFAGAGFADLLGSTPAIATDNRRVSAARSMTGVPFEPLPQVRVGVIGVGNRGSAMVSTFLDVAGTQISAVCDVDRARAGRAVQTVEGVGRPRPAQHVGDEWEFERLCQRDDVDLVYVATPWEWHYRMARSAMRHGKHVAVETPLAMTMPDLWSLVDTSEAERRHCIQLENACYGQTELRLLRMAHKGLFGELVHAAGGYLHDLRAPLFSPTGYSNEWRRGWHTRLHGNLYPTHGLGPIAACLDINRGDRLVRMVSMESAALGLAAYRKAMVPPGASAWNEKYLTGDLCISLIQTAKGRLIRLEHNVSNPRPYSRITSIAGTKGLFEDYPPRIHLEPDSRGHAWQSFDNYAGHDHWLWKEIGDPSRGGHGGKDYVTVWRLIQTMRLGLVPDTDVYDSATWSAPVALSGESIARNGGVVEFPDFTRGRWRARRPGLDAPRPA